ncbi:hypothetical protein YC2023_056232 [Brassica napus]
MGTGEKALKGFHLLRKQTVKNKDVPKGCLAIKLLKEAEDEYGFDQKGTITIPCDVAEFRYVQDLIDGERSVNHNHHHRHSGRDQYHHLVGCFRG